MAVKGSYIAMIPEFNKPGRFEMEFSGFRKISCATKAEAVDLAQEWTEGQVWHGGKRIFTTV